MHRGEQKNMGSAQRNVPEAIDDSEAWSSPEEHGTETWSSPEGTEHMERSPEDRTWSSLEREQSMWNGLGGNMEQS
jgi:hypothetical protein